MFARIAAVVALLCLATASVHAQSDPLTITTASATVHRSPSVASPAIGHATRGDVLTVTRDVGDWVKVVWPSDPSGVGYVRTREGVRGRPAASPTQASQAAPSAEPGRRASNLSTSTDTRASLAAPQSTSTRPPSRPNPTAYVARPSHVIGLGARLSSPSLGIGGSLRAWSPGWLGLQVDLSRYSVTTPFDPTSMNTTQFAPSVLFKPADMISDYVWVRPYAGAGFAMFRSTLNSPTVGVTATDNRTALQFLGGAEFTAASLSNVGVSVEYTYRRFETPFAGYDLGRGSFAVAAHWYVR